MGRKWPRRKATTAKRRSASQTSRGPPWLQLLPVEMCTTVLSLLSWKDTLSLSHTCRRWRHVVKTAQNAHVEWRNTVVCARNGAQAVAQLCRDDSGIWTTRFPPSLVLLSVTTRNDALFRRGHWWQQAVSALTSRQPLPPACVVVGILSGGIVASGERHEDDDAIGCEAHEYVADMQSEDAVVVSVTVACLPDTSIQVATLDRKTLKHAMANDTPNPFGKSRGAVRAQDDGFLAFTTNATSANALVDLVRLWQPGAALVGAVLPLADRASAIMTCCPVIKVADRRYGACRRTNTAWAKQLDFPSTVLLRISGRVGIHAFAATAFEPMQPPLRCHRVTVSECGYTHQYDEVSVVDGASLTAGVEGERRSLAQTLQHYDPGLWEHAHLFTCDTLSPLLSQPLVSDELGAETLRLQRLHELVVSDDGQPMTLEDHWNEGDYALLAVENAAVGCDSQVMALNHVRKRMEMSRETALGGFVVSANILDLFPGSNSEAEIYNGVFPGVPLTGCMSNGGIGPVAHPVGIAAWWHNSAPQFQIKTNFGAIFVDRCDQRNDKAVNSDH